MTFLATTASVTPFIGLFGTVVGIMIAFQRIGATGSTNLAIVGAGHQRGADRHRGRAVRGDSRARVLQPLHAPREGVLGDDGRFRARVPQYRRAQLHIDRANAADLAMPKVIASAPNAGGRHQRGRRVAPTLSEINVVPMVDVMLVLLIIFMVAAPMLQRGVEVNLPVASRSQEISSERVFLDMPGVVQRRSACVHRQGGDPDRRPGRAHAADRC